MSAKLKIGLFGFGCVGQGLYHVLQNCKSLNASIDKIAVKHKEKVRGLPQALFVYDKHEILADGEINVVVELIDDAEEAFIIVSDALKKGKHVVSANKKMIAAHLEELIALQKTSGASLLYEAAVCGSIPIIRTLEEYFNNEPVEQVYGIFNGTTNYILSKAVNENLSYDAALSEARHQGFAETDPSDDVKGNDAKFKAVIVALHAFGLVVEPKQVFNLGITSLKPEDIAYALERGFRIRLVPVIKQLKQNQVCAFVIPRFVTSKTQLHAVENEFNGVVVDGKFSGEQFLCGSGAGSYPTGAAVLSDISALSQGYRYSYKKHIQAAELSLNNNLLIDVYLRYNTAADLDRITFTEIYQQYVSKAVKYVVGRINLLVLIKEKDYLASQQLFVACVGDKLLSGTEKKEGIKNKSETLTQHAAAILS